MEIQTKRLLLCPLGLKYLNSTFEYASDIENTKYMKYLPSDAIEETVEFLTGVEKEWQKSAPENYEFAILADGVHIGAICLCLNKDRTEGELGWIINKKYWHKGYAFEAAQALIEYFVGVMKMKHFIAHCDSENIASYGLMEKLGMRRVSCSGGRRNKSSSEERMEYMYELIVE